MLTFAEGYDDYASESDLSLSAAAVANCAVIAGRGGNGFAAQIGVNLATLAYEVAASAGSNVIVGFALKGISGLDPFNYIRTQFQAGGVALFSIVQASAAGLLFFDATNPLTPTPYSGLADLSTGLIGSATFKNWGSYIEVQLRPGNPGFVTVLIDGNEVLNTAGAFGPLLSTVLETNNVQNGTTSFNVLTDLGLATPFNATLSSGTGVQTRITVTATAGTGHTNWTCLPISTGHVYNTNDPVSAPAPVGVCNGLTFSTQSGAGITAIGAIDDLYICDTTGARNNAFLGNTRILSQAPNSDGAFLQWTPSSGSVHYSLVDAYPINYGATNVQASLTGLNDCYGFPALPNLGAFGTLRALQVVVYCESLSGGGTNLIAPFVDIGGVPYYATAELTPAVWQAVTGIFETNPSNGDPWTAAGVNAAQAGQQNVGVD